MIKTEIIDTTYSTAFMTSPIGDLSIDSDGLRKAIDEIVRLRNIINNMENKKAY